MIVPTLPAAPVAPSAPALLAGVSALVDRFDGFILDLWGVIHDGIAPYPGALECLARLRAAGKRVCLLSNAPRRERDVAATLEALGVGEGHYHHLVTAGEATFGALVARSDPWYAQLGTLCLHLGPDQDRGVVEDVPGVALVDHPESAHFVVLTGPSSYDETPLDFGPVLAACARRGLPMVCANPDLEVMVGERWGICAGTLARRYQALGGEVRYQGKPFAPVYRECLRRLGFRDRGRVVALGDTVATDIAGARAAGLQGVLITGGIHRRALGCAWGQRPSAAALEALWVESLGLRPEAVLPCLVW